MIYAAPPQSAVASCRVLRNRHVMLEHLPREAIVAEIGTREGHFARAICDVAKPREIHLIDRNWSKFEREKFLDEIKAKKVFLHNVDSSQGIRKFADGYFDWIYIDAVQDYADVKRDTLASVPKVKEGGYLIFNDYIRFTRRGTEFGVIRAANELLIGGGWEMKYLGLQKGGYHDVALQKIKWQ